MIRINERKFLHGYAAEIRSLDESLERYFKATEPKTASAWPSLTLFCGLRGFPLGEHLHVGIPPDNQRRKDDATNVDDTGPADELYCENLHVPFFLTSNATTTDSSETGETNLKFDRAQFEGDRVDQFLQTSDIAAILRKWLETPENGDLEIPTRELAFPLAGTNRESKLMIGHSSCDQNKRPTTPIRKILKMEFGEGFSQSQMDRLEITRSRGFAKKSLTTWSKP